MSRLILVRHGQASFGKANYDKLSELGETQCRLLGEYWTAQGLKLDAVYVGTLERQRRSLEMASLAYAMMGVDFPEPIVDENWNEYDASAMLTGSIPTVIKSHPDIAELAARLAPEGKPDLAANRKVFNRLLARVMSLWVEGALDGFVGETWAQFRDRVGAAIGRVMDEWRGGKTAAVFTSGGPVSAALQKALNSPDMESMEIGWSIYNASLSEFRYNEDKFSLVSFNAAPHLNRKELITLR